MKRIEMLAWLAAGAIGAGFVQVSVADEKPTAQPPAAAKPADAKPTDAKPAEAKAAAADDDTAYCPVTSKKLTDFSISTKYRNKLVYFADKEALEKFTQEADPYLDAVKAQWKALRPRRVQVLCPVTGKPCDEQFSAPLGHGSVHFASAEALETWKKESKSYEAKLDACYTFQTNCLVCGHEVSPDLSVDIKGRKIYTACGGCVETIKGNPEKYLKKADDMIAANKASWEKHHPPAEKAK